jgi:hypothetical protein
MYLRHTIRKENGKVHRYWRLLRSIRVGRRVIQQTVAHLGEIDERGRFGAAECDGEKEAQRRGLPIHLRGLRALLHLRELEAADIVAGRSLGRFEFFGSNVLADSKCRAFHYGLKYAEPTCGNGRHGSRSRRSIGVRRGATSSRRNSGGGQQRDHQIPDKPRK